MVRSTLFGLLVLWAAATLSSLAKAENVDLSTVPSRQTVQLTIYNSEDLTLVRETRAISFKRGANPLQFSWANTLIDPTSVELRFLTAADKLEVLDTTFPHDKPQMLYWNVQSELEGEATVEITYFTSGITWSADYLCIADPAEASMNFEGFVRVQNNSGEEYENAQIRLVVGTINLVEKIAQLARVPMDQVKELDRRDLAELRVEAAGKAMKAGGFGGGGDALEQKQIIKEGLSEYFIYTVDGTETIPNGWSKRLRSLEAQKVPFHTAYRYRPEQYGDQLVRLYVLTNDKPSKLGESPLPDGVVRVFRDNGRDGLSYLTAESVKYIPIGDKIELNLGPDPQVVFELVPLRAWRDHIWMQLEGTQTFKEVDGKTEVEERASVVGWDDHTLFAQRIRNYTGKPIHVEVRRALPGHAVFRSGLEAKNHDYRTVEFRISIEPRQRAELLYELIQHQGHNHKQENVTLEQAEISR